MNKKHGFTLIELLITMAIMSILATIGMTSYLNVQKNARDVKRRADLKDLQNALEQYYSVCGFVYPTALNGSPIICQSPSQVLMQSYPLDPKTTTPYLCSEEVTCDSSGYEICSQSSENVPENSICINNKQ